jgi:hypothetical protein
MAVDVAEAEGEDEVMDNRTPSPSPDLREAQEAANRDQSMSPVTIPSHPVGHEEFIIEGSDAESADGFAPMVTTSPLRWT